MATDSRPAFRIMTLLLCSLAVPLAVRAADAPEPVADVSAIASAAVEPVCVEQVHTGSRIKSVVCPGDESYDSAVHMGEQLRRPGDRQFTRSTRFPGLTVRSGATSGVSVHQ